MYAKDAGNSDVSNIRKKKSVVYSNAEGLGERMQQKIKEMLIKIKDVLVSVWHSYKRMRQENNIYFNILVGLVFFAIVGTGVCMVANAREAAALRQVEIQKEKEAQEKKKAEEEAKKAEEAAKAERDKSMSLQPGVTVGTMDPQDDEKVVYLTFDDGPSANTQRVLDILAVTAKQYDIHVISFVNLVDGKEITCFDPDLSPEEERQKGTEYYQAMSRGCEIKTGLISTAAFEEAFRSALEADQDVLYFSLSKNISGTYNSARLASEELLDEFGDKHKIRLVDSLNASLAQGILAIYASEMRAKGMSVDEVADTLEYYVEKMNGVFTVGDLKYLSRTGRIKGSVATIGNVLKIKPILRGNKDGYIVFYKNCRGRKSALNELVNLVCDNIVEPEKQILGIAHADAYEDSLYIMDKIQQKIKVRDFINTSYDFCTGSHVGPDTIALFFIGKDRELS